MKYLIILAVLLTAASAGQAQMSKEPPLQMPPGRTAAPPVAPKSYPDSVKFKEAFKELFLLIKPAQSVRERTQNAFLGMSRSFKTRGVDSAKAWDSVSKKIDDNQDEKILFDAYRKEFTAEELKSITTFMKSPAGKHYFEVEAHLSSAKSMLTTSVQRGVQATVGPMMKPIERPAGLPGGPGGRRPPMGRPGMMRDSLGRPIPGAPPSPGVPPTPPPSPDPNKSQN